MKILWGRQLCLVVNQFAFGKAYDGRTDLLVLTHQRMIIISYHDTVVEPTVLLASWAIDMFLLMIMLVVMGLHEWSGHPAHQI